MVSFLHGLVRSPHDCAEIEVWTLGFPKQTSQTVNTSCPVISAVRHVTNSDFHNPVRATPFDLTIFFFGKPKLHANWRFFLNIGRRLSRHNEHEENRCQPYRRSSPKT